MATSANGWPVLDYGDRRIRRFVIPTSTGNVTIPLRDGSAGFLLAWFLLWWSEAIEPLTGRIADDWGHAVRAIRGKSSGYSNHASGTAADANAVAHPLGTRTLTVRERAKITWRLIIFRGVLRSGAFYRGRVDEMHVEVNASLPAAERVAKRLLGTRRGQAILTANPGLQAVILS